MEKMHYGPKSYTPPGWTSDEWQIMWRKLWLLPLESIRSISKKTKTYFSDKEVQDTLATKEEFIDILDEADKQELIAAVDSALADVGITKNDIESGDIIKNLDSLLKEKGLLEKTIN